MSLNNLKDGVSDVRGKTVFLRVDFNVPLSGTKIKEDFKIRQALESISFLLRNDCNIVIASHLGQPKNGFDKKYSLSPVAKHLSLLLAQPVTFLDFKKFSKFPDIRKEINSGLKKGRNIFLLDNLRFFSGEDRDCKRLGRSLASLADVYVNDAFAVSHRANSSVSSIKSFLPSYTGLLLQKEIYSLNKILKPEKPFVAIMGGVKISTKIPIIKKIYPQASQILIGGALANNFFMAMGLNVGKSLVDKKEVNLAKKFLKSKKIILPIDVIVKTEVSSKKNIIGVKNITDVSDNDYILDIGPETILLFSRFIKKAQTLVWNGPLGMFEEDNFKKGTIILAREIAARSKGRAFGVAGGGETVEALNLSGMAHYMDWVSTGGGAMLAYLSGDDMPGL